MGEQRRNRDGEIKRVVGMIDDNIGREKVLEFTRGHQV